jgi:hypothetical protein
MIISKSVKCWGFQIKNVGVVNKKTSWWNILSQKGQPLKKWSNQTAEYDIHICMLVKL